MGIRDDDPKKGKGRDGKRYIQGTLIWDVEEEDAESTFPQAVRCVSRAFALVSFCSLARVSDHPGLFSVFILSFSFCLLFWGQLFGSFGALLLFCALFPPAIQLFPQRYELLLRAS